MKYPSLFTTSSREYLSMLERVNKLTEIYPIENLKLMMIVLIFECRPNLFLHSGICIIMGVATKKKITKLRGLPKTYSTKQYSKEYLWLN